jgi:leucine-rich repeat-containing G protein-coupled receptor 6
MFMSVASSMGDSPPTVVCPWRCACQFTDVGGTYTINCTRQGLEVIPDLSSLQDIVIHRLMLTQNSITNIPAGTFSNLRIRWIELDHNKLEAFSGEDLTGLEDTLEFLSLSGNAVMTSFDGTAFGRFTQLRTLSLVGLGSAIDELTTMFLGNMPYLEVLLLSENGFTFLPDDTFQGLTNLRELALDGCKLTDIPAAVGSLSNILYLSVANNNIETLDNDILNKLAGLKTLNLSKNRHLAPALVDGVFSGLHLEELHLSFCGMKKLSKKVGFQNRGYCRIMLYKILTDVIHRIVLGGYIM